MDHQQTQETNDSEGGTSIWAYIVIITFLSWVLISFFAIICNVVVVKIFEFWYGSSHGPNIQNQSTIIKNIRVERTMDKQKQGLFEDIGSRFGETEWVICITPFQQKDNVTVTNECHHTFHSQWLREWYENIQIIRLLTWPLCHTVNREDYVEGDIEENQDNPPSENIPSEVQPSHLLQLSNILLSHQNSQPRSDVHSEAMNKDTSLDWNIRKRTNSQKVPQIQPQKFTVFRTWSDELQPERVNFCPLPRLTNFQSQNVADTNFSTSDRGGGVIEHRVLTSPDFHHGTYHC